MLGEQTLKEYLEQLSSAAPAPGGGSAGGVAAALGISLGLMALRLAQHRESEGQARVLPRLVEEGEDLRLAFLQLAEADGQAYMELSRTRRRVRHGEAGTQDLEAAAAEAVRVPLALGGRAVQGLDWLTRSFSLTSPSMVPDVEAGARFLYATLQGAWSNVEANLDQLGDGNRKREARRIIEEQEGQASALLGTLGLAPPSQK